MTTRKPTDLFRTLKRIMMPRELKERMRADLSSYADLHALHEALSRSPVQSPFSFASLMVPARSLYAGALALVLVVAGGTQASFASEGAVPGDILYPMKVIVSEPLTLALTPSSAGKAELAAKFASRRVDEAALLSSVGRLDENTANELATNFDTHVDILAKETETLEAKGEIAVSLAVRTDLEQKLSDRAEEFAVAEVADDDVAAPESEEDAAGTAERFAARVTEKSRSLATTRERLESALALDIAAELNEGGLAALRSLESDEQTQNAPAHLFFAKEKPSEVSATATLMVEATSTATTTATSTEEVDSPGSRFFMPFLKR